MLILFHFAAFICDAYYFLKLWLGQLLHLSLLYYFMHFYPSVDSVADFSYFNSSDYNFFPDSFRLLFNSARDGLLFRFLTDLPVEISDDPTVAAHLQPTYSFLNSGPSLNLSIPQAQDPHRCDEESLSNFSTSTWCIPPSIDQVHEQSEPTAICPTNYSGPVSSWTLHSDYIADSHWGYDTDETMPPDKELGNEVNNCDSVSVTVSAPDVIYISSDSDSSLY